MMGIVGKRVAVTLMAAAAAVFSVAPSFAGAGNSQPIRDNIADTAPTPPPVRLCGWMCTMGPSPIVIGGVPCIGPAACPATPGGTTMLRPAR
jgi:hypothetical protein